jgi:hypothetical protein
MAEPNKRIPIQSATPKPDAASGSGVRNAMFPRRLLINGDSAKAAANANRRLMAEIAKPSRMTMRAVREGVAPIARITPQQVRICAENALLPPLIVVQAGPGFALLHEVRKFQSRLALEKHFTVCYWDQRGCGNASKSRKLSRASSN